ncbi:YhgE/Pip C-terminal domain protein [Bacillus methanolicus PB1]|uniref:YhgE/Pip C-terminal domain protein n=1 Tax=Bacillus methanolicus PB1 TaxID=997296 RepID=I3E614_BACMT|nr:YhgE/Pip domain-containing protein [Bacillus methanolicus]EIJ81935.1 YhgE/Pip C-terminal domain protein [Bacillus methanolicus PB1]
MKNFLLKKEFSAIIKNKKLLIPIISVLFIPIIYSGMFLWAFWDPYAHLDNLPVAVVNEDKGAMFEGEELNLGDELVSKLKDKKDFNFIFVEKEEGYKKLEDQEYYMLVEIPDDFSKNATTLMNENPKKLDLIYVPNESYNFLSAQIGENAMVRIKASLSKEIIETYAETMFDKVAKLSDGMKTASDGAKKLSDGAKELSSGSKTFHESLVTLAEKLIQFNNGMKEANEGSKEVADGATSLSSGLSQLLEGHRKLHNAANELKTGSESLASGMSQANAGIQKAERRIPQLVSGTEKLQTGAKTFSCLLKHWQTGAESAAQGAKKLNEGTVLLESNLKSIMPMLPPEQKQSLEAALNSLKQGSAELANGTGQLASSAGQLAAGADTLTQQLGVLKSGQEQLQIGMTQLAEAGTELEKGANKIAAGQKEFVSGMSAFGEKITEAKDGSVRLAKGASKLTGGVNQLTEGSSQLVDGSGKLEEGAQKIADGNSKIFKGNIELSGKLANGAKKASSVDADEKTYNMMAEPVKVKNEKLNEVPNYGTGFAPYFLSLGLFVGALVLTIVYPIREPAAVPRNGLSWFFGKFGIMAAAGIIQALISDIILLGVLGLDVKSLPLFVLFSVITSLAFVTLIQFFVTLFGDPGRFIAIIILILQLTTSAGTFPLELIPDFLQPFNAFLPMTYSVAGFKAVISSGNFSFMWENFMILLIYALIFMVGTLAYFNAMHKRRFIAVK